MILYNVPRQAHVRGFFYNSHSITADCGLACLIDTRTLLQSDGCGLKGPFFSPVDSKNSSIFS